MLVIGGVLCIMMGIKGFTPDGIPLSKNKVITGPPAYAIGVGCILIGLLFIGFTIVLSAISKTP